MDYEASIADTAHNPGPPLADGSRCIYRLLEAADALENDRPERARGLLTGLIEQTTTGIDAESRLARAFARALLARLDGDLSGGGNLYAREAGPGAMLAAYDVLVEATPLVRFGYLAANAAIIAAIGETREVHLVDIGIGSGRQWMHLFRQLARRPGGPLRLRLTGIDVPEPGDAPDRRLLEVGAALRREAEAAGIDLEFRGLAMAAETIDRDRLELRAGEVLVINAALALHHLPDGRVVRGNPRQRLLETVRALGPRLVTLVEPDVDHNGLPFPARLRASIRHYGAVFEVLEALLPAGLEARAIIEQVFFGQEIVNVVAGEGAGRVERHERHARWHRRMRRAGFEPVDLGPIAEGVREALELTGRFKLSCRRGALLLGWQGSPVIAASAWRPAGDT